MILTYKEREREQILEYGSYLKQNFSVVYIMYAPHQLHFQNNKLLTSQMFRNYVYISLHLKHDAICNLLIIDSCCFDPRRLFMLYVFFSLWSCGHLVTDTFCSWFIVVESVFGNSDALMFWLLSLPEDKTPDCQNDNNSLKFADFCWTCCSWSFLCCLCSLWVLLQNPSPSVLFSSPRNQQSIQHCNRINIHKQNTDYNLVNYKCNNKWI